LEPFADFDDFRHFITRMVEEEIHIKSNFCFTVFKAGVYTQVMWDCDMMQAIVIKQYDGGKLVN
jgi:hypothetical protein